jgi:glucokinase
MKYNIGIDIGGTNISFGLVTETGIIKTKNSLKTDKVTAETTIKNIISALQSFIKDNNSPEINSIGIGCPGTCNNTTGIVEYSNNLDWKNISIKKEFQQAFNVPTFLDNDANAAAFGEFMAGAAKGRKNAVIITLGTGVGAGIIIDGKVFRGTDCAGDRKSVV